MQTRYIQRELSTVGLVAYYKLHQSLMVDTTGSETITNGTFTGNADNWEFGPVWVYGDNALIATADGTAAVFFQAGTSLVSGTMYRIKYDISNSDMDNIGLAFSSSSAFEFRYIDHTNGTHIYYFPKSNASPLQDIRFLLHEESTIGKVLTIDNISVIPIVRKVFDYSLNGNTGLLIDAGTALVLQPKYPGYNFDGSANFIDVGNHGGAIKTIVMWVKATSIGSNDYPIDLNGTDYISIESGTVTANGFAGSAIYVDGVSASTITAGKWHFIALTLSTAKTASDFDIGRAEGQGLFTGLIGETRLYTRELNAAEIKSIYEITRGRYGV